jgi:hypothetical protein
VNSTARLRQLLAGTGVALALALVPQATSASRPLLALGPITIANSTAIFSGTVGGDAAGAALSVNGQKVGVDAAGHFAAVANLRGAHALDLALVLPAGTLRITYSIPLTGSLLTIGGVIPANVLAALQQAGVTLAQPILNGNVLTVAGSVLDPSRLASLTINGVDVLSSLGPNFSFSIQLPGTTQTLTIVATDTHGVTQTTVERVQFVAQPAWVSASQAVGLRIAGVRYLTKGVRRTHRMRMIVTVKDSRGLLVRGARVVVRGTKAGRIARKPKTTSTGLKGRATVFLRLRRAAYGKRLFTVTVAKTPTAKALKRSSVRVPRKRG